MTCRAGQLGNLHLSRPAQSSSRGFSLIELLIVVAIILIIAAIAIPNFMRARMAANEAAAVAACKKITTAEVTYYTTYGRGYSNQLSELGPPAAGGRVGPASAELLDEVVVSGSKHGYVFTYAAIDTNGDGINEAFTLNADPQSQGKTGDRHFFIDQSGVVRQNRTGPASATDLPIG
jgi:prepilin-type N-terminal cleavage/methylation domain-containing protein